MQSESFDVIFDTKEAALECLATFSSVYENSVFNEYIPVVIKAVAKINISDRNVDDVAGKDCWIAGVRDAIHVKFRMFRSSKDEPSQLGLSRRDEYELSVTTVCIAYGLHRKKD